MDYRRFGDTLVIRMDPEEEILATLKTIALKENIKLASVQALGAVSSFRAGVYDLARHEYHVNRFEGAYEIVSLTGSINTMNGEYYSHLHIAAGDEKGSVAGGHLNEAIVSATCEMFVTIIDGTVDRIKSPDTGINVFRF